MSNETIMERFTMRVQPINNTDKKVMFKGSPWNRDYKNNATLGTMVGPRLPRLAHAGSKSKTLGKALDVIA